MTTDQTARGGDDGRIRRSLLPGGLRVVTEDIASARSFNLGIFVAVGSRDEGHLVDEAADGAPAGAMSGRHSMHGASHFLEHVLFKATPTRTAEQISAEIEAFGGDLNAYTTREYTCFHARVLGEQSHVALDVLTDMLSHSLITPGDFSTEREVILDEIAMHDDDSTEVAVEKAIAALFAGTELGPTVIGSSSSIRRQSAARVREYWRENYTSDRIVVAAVGKVDHDELCRALAGFDAELAPSPQQVARRSPRRAARPVAGGAVVTRSTEISQTAVVLAFGSFGALDPRREALALLCVALGGGMSSRLFLEVRERRALAYTIDCSESSWNDAGLVTIDWQALPERTDEICEVVRQIVAEVRERGITAAELEAARGQLIGQSILHYDNPAARMSRLGSAELSGDARSIDEVLDAYRAVTLDEVNALARVIFGQLPVVSLAGAGGSRAAARRLHRDWLLG